MSSHDFWRTQGVWVKKNKELEQLQEVYSKSPDTITVSDMMKLCEYWRKELSRCLSDNGYYLDRLRWVKGSTPASK